MKVYHFRRESGKTNFGDDLSPGFVASVLGERVAYASPLTAQIMAAGSILSYWTKRDRSLRRGMLDMLTRRAPIAIWGSGLVAERNLVLPKVDILAVRGPLTAKCMKIDGDVIYGDPGLLASLVMPPVPKTGKIGIVPHYVDKANKTLDPFREDARFMVIDVELPWERVLKEISSCAMVLSSSLHGLIVADSYGVPNMRLKFSNLINGGDFKFLDYGLSVGRSDVEGRVIVRPEDIEKAVLDLSGMACGVPKIKLEKMQEELISILVEWRER